MGMLGAWEPDDKDEDDDDGGRTNVDDDDEEEEGEDKSVAGIGCWDGIEAVRAGWWVDTAAAYV